MNYYIVAGRDREIIAGPYETPGEAMDATRAARVLIDRRHFYGPFDMITVARSLEHHDTPYNLEDILCPLMIRT